MSTALPSGPGTEAVVQSASGRAAPTTEDLPASPPTLKPTNDLDAVSDLPQSRSYAAANYSADVEVLIRNESSADIHTVLLDEPFTASKAGPHLAAGEHRRKQPAPFDSAGSLLLEPPKISGALDGLFYQATKRAIDVAASVVLLVLLSPLLLLSALLIKLADGGSVFYPHIRVGEGGNEFTCYKFRSMVVNAENMKDNLAFFNSHEDHKTFKIPDDPRVTWIGRLMRRSSVDELPQLWNVLKGEMSIVGPRPPVVSEVEQYTWDDMQRLVVKPGLTCIWQVSGRSRLPFPEQLKMDMQYIENRSLALDLKLIAKTLPAVLSADGAY